MTLEKLACRSGARADKLWLQSHPQQKPKGAQT